MSVTCQGATCCTAWCLPVLLPPARRLRCPTCRRLAAPPRLASPRRTHSALHRCPVHRMLPSVWSASVVNSVALASPVANRLQHVPGPLRHLQHPASEGCAGGRGETGVYGSAESAGRALRHQALCKKSQRRTADPGFESSSI